MDSPVGDLTTQGGRGADFASRENIDVLRVRFEQYKLAVEMADRMSSKRQAANQFFMSEGAAAKRSSFVVMIGFLLLVPTS